MDKNVEQKSILDFARIRAKKLSLRFKAIGVVLAIFVSITYSIYNHYSIVNSILDVAKANLSQSLQIGGIYYQERLAQSIVQTNLFDNVWIFDSSENLIVERINKGKTLSFASLNDRRLHWYYGLPYIIVKKDIRYQAERAGTLFVSYQLPVLELLFIVFLVFITFAILSKYTEKSITKLGEDIATPVFDFMEKLENKIEAENLSKPIKGKFFLELTKFENWFKDYFTRAKKSKELAEKALTDAQTAKIASQVRHDVQGAIMIANSAIDRIDGHTDEIGTLKASLERVRSTVNEIPKFASLKASELNEVLNINETNFQTDEKENIKNHHLLSIIEQIRGEFSLTYSNISFPKLYNGATDIYSQVDSNRLERLLVNIYKNAVEAITVDGEISTEVIKQGDAAIIKIADTGKGIPQEILNRIGERGVTYGKENGTGLGLAHAIENIKKWNGDLVVQSKLNRGTTIEIKLPLCEANPIYPSEILLNKGSSVVILDDDPTIHASWKRKFTKINKEANISFEYFTSPKSASKYIEALKAQDKDFFLLGDYDLRDNQENGISFIKKHKLEECSMLVTSSSRAVGPKCEEMELPVISKAIQEIIPVYLIS